MKMDLFPGDCRGPAWRPCHVCGFISLRSLLTCSTLAVEADCLTSAEWEWGEWAGKLQSRGRISTKKITSPCMKFPKRPSHRAPQAVRGYCVGLEPKRLPGQPAVLSERREVAHLGEKGAVFSAAGLCCCEL